MLWVVSLIENFPNEGASFKTVMGDRSLASFPSFFQRSALLADPHHIKYSKTRVRDG